MNSDATRKLRGLPADIYGRSQDLLSHVELPPITHESDKVIGSQCGLRFRVGY